MKTIIELEEITGYSREPIRKMIIKKFPGKIQNSFKTELSEEEADIIIKALGKKRNSNSISVGFRWSHYGNSLILQKRIKNRWVNIPFVKGLEENTHCPLCGKEEE